MTSYMSDEDYYRWHAECRARRVEAERRYRRQDRVRKAGAVLLSALVVLLVLVYVVSQIMVFILTVRGAG